MGNEFGRKFVINTDEAAFKGSRLRGVNRCLITVRAFPSDSVKASVSEHFAHHRGTNHFEFCLGSKGSGDTTQRQAPTNVRAAINRVEYDIPFWARTILLYTCFFANQGKLGNFLQILRDGLLSNLIEAFCLIAPSPYSYNLFRA
jgi:hypothetical protein